MFVIKARFCNNGKLLLGKYQNGICPADPTGPDTVLIQATFSLIHAFRGTIVTPRASLRRNPARRTRRFFALSTFRWETVLIPSPRIENSLSPLYRGYRLFNSHRDFSWLWQWFTLLVYTYVRSFFQRHEKVMRFTLKNPCSLQYIDYQNVKNGIFRLSKSGTLTETFVWGHVRHWLLKPDLAYSRTG